jgi:hypothetical protein
MLILLAFIVELIGSGAVCIWLIATLGFADEANRSRKASATGKVMATLCVLTALASPLVTLVTIIQYYFFNASLQTVVHPLAVPILTVLVSAVLCGVLVYLYKRSYEQR